MTAQFREKIGPLQGSCKGLTCWVVGSGPSLDDVDIGELRDQYILALNAAVLKFTNVRKFPDAWWVWYDSRTLREVGPRVKEEWRRVQSIIHKKGMEDTRTWKCAGRYVEYVKEEFKASRSVAETAILLAQFLGFSTVVLVGVDGLQALNGRPYASGLEWKACHFMTSGDQASCAKSSRQMVSAMEELKGRLAKRGDVPRIVQTSPYYPDREQFECMSFKGALEMAHAVPAGRRAPASL